jgi:hypothetical protein
VLTAESQLAKVLVVELFLAMTELDAGNEPDDREDRDDVQAAGNAPIRSAELVRQAS